jgi:Phosphotransferase enzyme family
MLPRVAADESGSLPQRVTHWTHQNERGGGEAMRAPGDDELRVALEKLCPGSRLIACEPLGGDGGASVGRKEAGYGQPLKLILEEADGTPRILVFRTASHNEFGHDRRSDRAGEVLLAFDTFPLFPGHVRALDVGAITPAGLRTLADAGELYLITTFAEGRLYADDLRRVASEGMATQGDLERCDALARWLVDLHRTPCPADGVAWRRAIRDLVGHGEGIFGVVEAYPPDVPGAPRELLERIEHRCLDWRWRLRERTDRLHRTHGDFHPFNIVFSEGARFTVLDASRGGRGDPADDLTALSINYLFFALQAPGTWERGFGRLWRRFWNTYLAGSRDNEILHTAAPFLAWRALVLCCPRFYPDLGAEARRALLDLAERVLDAACFVPGVAEELFA